MKKVICLIIIILLCTGLEGCKKFLNVVPIDNLSGNNFWETKADVEAFTGGIYNLLRNATMRDSRFFVATGDLRCAPANITSEHSSELYVSYLRKNDLKGLLSNTKYLKPTDTFWAITLWTNFFNVVQNANILYDQVEKMPESVLSAEDKKSYQAEAVFLRCISYFFMVRVFGNVPYYTNAFNSEALPRTNMITVLKNCNDELAAVKNDLPWTYADIAKVAVRAMRGSVIALMMHINMWEAGFDQANQLGYYTTVAALGEEIMTQSGGAYQLLPLINTYDIFRGNSKEGLFEIVQQANSAEQFLPNAVYSNYVLLKPYQPFLTSTIWYDAAFMARVYPTNVTDNRKTQWFDANLYAADGTQQMLKFVNIKQGPSTGSLQVGNQVVFRYADVVLLRAEALANLGRDNDALPVLNLIRQRAGAPDIASNGDALKSDIYYERVRELMGEGHYFYDLVRTRKAIDGNFTFSPITDDGFARGAWTWPIDVTATANNPFMTLNQYWN